MITRKWYLFGLLQCSKQLCLPSGFIKGFVQKKSISLNQRVKVGKGFVLAWQPSLLSSASRYFVEVCSYLEQNILWTSMVASASYCVWPSLWVTAVDQLIYPACSQWASSVLFRLLLNDPSAALITLQVLATPALLGLLHTGPDVIVW